MPFSILTRIVKLPKSQDLLLLLPNPDGILLARLRNGRFIERSTFPQEKGKFRGFTAYLENERRIWVGADIGLIRLNLEDSSFEVYDEFEKEPVRRIRGIAKTEKENLIIATEKDGLYYFNLAEKEFNRRVFSYEHGEIRPFSHSVRGIYLDKGTFLNAL